MAILYPKGWTHVTPSRKYTFTSFVNEDSGTTIPGTVVITEASEILNAGTHTIHWTFTPEDAANIEGTGGTCEITVTKADPEITELPVPEAITYHPNRSLADIKIPDGRTSVPGTWSWADEKTLPTVKQSSYPAVFTPADTANYNTAERELTLTVAKADPVFTALDAAAITYGQALADSDITAEAALAEDKTVMVEGTAVWTEPDTKPLAADSNTTVYSVLFTPEDTDNYNTAETEITLTVNKAHAPEAVPSGRIELPYADAVLSNE